MELVMEILQPVNIRGHVKHQTVGYQNVFYFVENSKCKSMASIITISLVSRKYKFLLTYLLMELSAS
jgi:hypothetical protein